MKGVFEIGMTTYRDDPAVLYHFPKRYLAVVRECVGDWIVYRDTRRGGGSTAYLAVAKVDSIIDDPTQVGGKYFARMSSMMSFDKPVGFKDDQGRHMEELVRSVDDPRLRGHAIQGRAVRPLAPGDFASIVDKGLRDTLDPENAIRLELDERYIDKETAGLITEAPTIRRIERMLVNRRIRDANFRLNVLDAYDRRCAVTGLRIVNGGGKAEAQGAHIWPVSEGGPDIVPNGIALSSTVHWMFDRHLITLTDDFELLFSHNKVPPELRNLFPPTGRRIHLPDDHSLRPRLDYVQRHRNIYAGH